MNVGGLPAEAPSTHSGNELPRHPLHPARLTTAADILWHEDVGGGEQQEEQGEAAHRATVPPSDRIQAEICSQGSESAKPELSHTLIMQSLFSVFR